MQIKVCGITRESDLRALAQLQVDFAGLIFYERSPRFAGSKITGKSVRELKGGLKTVGVFVNARQEMIASLVENYGLDMIQLHGDETPAYCRMIRQYAPVIRALRIAEDTDLESAVTPFLDSCDYFLFDTAGPRYGGNGKQFDWALLEKYRHDLPFFLSGGIGPTDIADLRAFHHDALLALDVNSRFELSPGVKQLDLVRTFSESIKLA